MLIRPSKKHKRNPFFGIIKKVYPRYIVRKFESFLGGALTVVAKKQ